MHQQLLISVIILFALYIIDAKEFSLPGDDLWPTTTDVELFKSTIKGEVFEKGDDLYKHSIFTYNLRTGPPQPLLVVIPENDDDIISTLAFAVKHNIRIAVKSTGHHQDVRSSVDDAILIFMKKYNDKELFEEAKQIKVGPGQTWGEIQNWLGEESGNTLVASTGADPTVGPAGWALGGGHGRLTRMVGLGADLIVSIDLILADGTPITASADSHPELFRALRGSSGNPFGIVTSLTFKVFEDPGVVTEFNGGFLITDEIANTYQDWMRDAPNNAGAYFIAVIDPETGAPVVTIDAYCIGDPKECTTALEPLSKIPGCAFLTCKVQQTHDSYSDFMKANNYSDVGGAVSMYMMSTAVDLKTDGQMEKISKWLNDYSDTEWPGALIGCYCNSVVGGYSGTLDPLGKETAVNLALRKASIAITCYVGWDVDKGKPRPDLIEKADKWADTVLKPTGINNFVYWNEPQHNFVSDEDWQISYYGSIEAYNQLLSVKKKYDPDYVLTCYHCVGWEDVENVDPAVCPDGCSCSNQKKNGVCAHKIPYNKVVTNEN